MDWWSPPVGGLLFLWSNFGWGLSGEWKSEVWVDRWLEWIGGFIFWKWISNFSLEILNYIFITSYKLDGLTRKVLQSWLTAPQMAQAAPQAVLTAPQTVLTAPQSLQPAPQIYDELFNENISRTKKPLPFQTRKNRSAHKPTGPSMRSIIFNLSFSLLIFYFRKCSSTTSSMRRSSVQRSSKFSRRVNVFNASLTVSL